jgi:ring-1,2-phenylacetyl-CoA epoxidase subunit PaaC
MDKLISYYTRIADNSLILGHQLGDYCSKAPFLEEDLAITNTALDLIGQAESVYEADIKIDKW